MSRVYRNTQLEGEGVWSFNGRMATVFFPGHWWGDCVRCILSFLEGKGDNQSIVCIGRSEVRWRSGIFGSISMESPCKGEGE